MQIDCQNYAYEHGIDNPDARRMEVAVLDC